MRNFILIKSFAKPLILSLITVIAFFVCLETSLRVLGYQPHIQFQGIHLPYWVSKVDSVFLDDYKKRLKILGKVNQDLYAYRADPILGYVLKPNYKRTIMDHSPAFPVDNMPGWTLISGKDGYRVSFHEEQIKNNSFSSKSVFILGDSSSFGWGVNFEDTYGSVFTEIVNRTLKPGDSSYQTLNRSIPGLSTFGGVKVIRQLNNIKPGDRVLVSLGSNDHAPASMTDHQRAINLQSTPEKLHRELERFLFFKMFRSFWLSIHIPINSDPKHLVNRVSIEEYNNNLMLIFETIRSYGGEPAFINICNLKEYTSVALELANATDTPFIDFIKQVRPLLSEVPRRFPKKFVQYFNVYGEKMKKNELYVILFPDGCHPNAIGHRLLGEILFEALERKPRKITESGRKIG